MCLGNKVVLPSYTTDHLCVFKAIGNDGTIEGHHHGRVNKSGVLPLSDF